MLILLHELFLTLYARVGRFSLRDPLNVYQAKSID